MIFDETTKKEFLDGYFVYDGCFGFEEDRYGFLLLENDKNKHQYRDPLPETQFLFIKTSRSIDERFYAINTKQFDFSTISAGTAPGKEDFVSVDTGGFVFSWDNEFENKIPNNIPDCNFISSIAKGQKLSGSIGSLDISMHKYSITGTDISFKGTSGGYTGVQLPNCGVLVGSNGIVTRLVGLFKL